MLKISQRFKIIKNAKFGQDKHPPVHPGSGIPQYGTFEFCWWGGIDRPLVYCVSKMVHGQGLTTFLCSPFSTEHNIHPNRHFRPIASTVFFFLGARPIHLCQKLHGSLMLSGLYLIPFPASIVSSNIWVLAHSCWSSELSLCMGLPLRPSYEACSYRRLQTSNIPLTN